MPSEQATDDFAEVDPEIFDPRAIRYREVGSDPDQDLVQKEPLRPKGDQLARSKAGEQLQLGGRADAGGDVFGAEDRGQMPQLRRHLRRDAGIPWALIRL